MGCPAGVMRQAPAGRCGGAGDGRRRGGPIAYAPKVSAFCGSISPMAPVSAV